jgi:hypothetical protein
VEVVSFPLCERQRTGGHTISYRRVAPGGSHQPSGGYRDSIPINIEEDATSTALAVKTLWDAYSPTFSFWS